MKYYRLFNAYYREIGGGRMEVARVYRHRFGIEQLPTNQIDTTDFTEITEAQYNRVKKLVLAKLLKN